MKKRDRKYLLPISNLYIIFFWSALKIDLLLGKWLLLHEVVEATFLSSLGYTKVFIFLTF